LDVVSHGGDVVEGVVLCVVVDVERARRWCAA
jgi:hypothetical protein